MKIKNEESILAATDLRQCMKEVYSDLCKIGQQYLFVTKQIFCQGF